MPLHWSDSPPVPAGERFARAKSSSSPASSADGSLYPNKQTGAARQPLWKKPVESFLEFIYRSLLKYQGIYVNL